MLQRPLAYQDWAAESAENNRQGLRPRILGGRERREKRIGRKTLGRNNKRTEDKEISKN